MTLTSDLADLLDDPLPARVRKVLDVAEAEGWQENPVVSLTVRLAKPDDTPKRPAEPPALPFYATWVLDRKDGKHSWRFQNARAKNGQALNYGDVLIYLQDTSVIYPEEPEGE